MNGTQLNPQALTWESNEEDKQDELSEPSEVTSV
jgi:hypothetical protein